MKFYIKLKSWQLFLLFLVVNNLTLFIPIVLVVLFLLIIYSLWIYSIGKIIKTNVKEKRENKSFSKLSYIFFYFCCSLFPLIGFLSVININRKVELYISIIGLIALVEMIYFSSRSLMISHTGLKKIWIIIGLLIPLIGVWYIQPKLNSIYNDAVALDVKESLK